MADENRYEVLGVRPEAPIWEIELAYKGRRSQYHPDRYAVGDEAAVAWATAKMQAVNKAYAVLKDPDQRECFNPDDLRTLFVAVSQYLQETN